MKSAANAPWARARFGAIDTKLKSIAGEAAFADRRLTSFKPDPVLRCCHCHAPHCHIIGIYHGWDVIEKNFCQLKNGLDFRRLRTHINETTEGKVFVGFLALILRTCLLGKVKAQTETKRFTLNKVLLELKKIKTVTMSDRQRLVTPLTKTQKTILAALGISHEALTNSVS